MSGGLSDLIEALSILLKYSDGSWAPIMFADEAMWIVGVDPDVIQRDDLAALKELSFEPAVLNCERLMQSFRFGEA